ncbi:hypothetical protein D5S17_17120 [Pseudonocardiaceae bacterium YIM PH 21723]|nr:hypothetical protein D5S17_17120 [Pseudonocardiaceae bacterium YIM PH 21723]
MTAGGGFHVDPAELRKFSSYLSGTAHSQIDTAAKGVYSANGFDNAAFGIFAAQLLAVPARIAMGVVTNNINALATATTEHADNVIKTAEVYEHHEDTTKQGFTAIKPDGA